MQPTVRAVRDERLFDRLLDMMTKGRCTALVVVAAFDTGDRARLNELEECEKYPTDYKTDVHTRKLVNSPRADGRRCTAKTNSLTWICFGTKRFITPRLYRSC